MAIRLVGCGLSLVSWSGSHPMGGDQCVGTGQEGGDDIANVAEVCWENVFVSSQWWVSVCTCLSLRYQSICLSQVPVCGQLVVTDTAGVGWCVQLARE